MALTVLLALTGTAPALRESRRLADTEKTKRDLLSMIEKRNRHLAFADEMLALDPQAVLVEIDRLGLTPAELLAEPGQGGH